MILTDIEELRKTNVKVNPEEVSELVARLEKELASSSVLGVGLAAPQIGIHKSIAIVRCKTGEYEENYDLINPIIVDKQQGFINQDEGCLSLPGKRVNTNRYREIFVKDELHPAGFVVVGFPAVVIQHEVDHLESILIIDRAAGKNKIGRNDLCPCGSGKKFKKCHGK